MSDIEEQRRHRNEYMKQWVKKNPERNRLSRKNWREKNIERFRATCRKANKKYWETNPLSRIKNRLNVKKYRETHKEKVRAYMKKYSELYAKNHKEERNLKLKEKYKKNTNYKLSVLIRGRLNKLISGEVKSGSSVRDLGCTIPELKFYLEGKFTDGMTWENWSQTGWHIDHVIPLSFFDLTDKEQFLKAVHYTNLQPLWATDNLKKSAKLSYA